MALVANGAVTADLGRLFGPGTGSGLTDRQLVDRVVRANGERGEVDLAFRALVDRHGSIVWGTCRQILGNVPDAEDAFQATFLVLLRRAGSLRVGESLAPWLHQVASRVARRACVDRSRDRARAGLLLEEVESPEGTSVPAPDQLGLLHEELERLPSRYRNPIVLCHLQGKTHEEAARALRCPIGTLSGRLSRARTLLRARLERKGWRSAEDLAGLLAPASLRIFVPPDLVARSLDLASPGPAGSTIPIRIHRLTKGVLKTMLWERCKAPAALVCMLATAAGGAAISARWPAVARAGGQSTDAPGPLTTPVALAAADPQAASSRPESTATRPDGVSSEELSIATSPPVVIRTVPESGATAVDPSLKEIKVTFSKEMRDGNWSWVTISKPNFPEAAGKIHYLEDRRTCVMPVKLEPGRTYAIWLNTTKFTNFKDQDRRPAVPYMLIFRTKG